MSNNVWLADSPIIQGVFNLYADGGLLSPNPSTIGGTMAFALTDLDDDLLAASFDCCITRTEEMRWRQSTRNPLGTIQVKDYQKCPALWPNDRITPDITETWAIVRGLTFLPRDWSGTVYSDNECALQRLFGTYSWNGVPDRFKRMCLDRVATLGSITTLLLNGHPSKKELAQGWKFNSAKIKRPVSEWNKLCDTGCDLMKKYYREQVRHDAQM